MEKKAIILLGAGAPLAWAGPLTSTITEELFKSNEFLTKSKLNLAQYIQNQLVAFHKCNRDQINFEYIINAMESISDYLSEAQSRGVPPQFTGAKPNWLYLSEAYHEVENFKFQLMHEDSDVGNLFNLAKPGDTPYPSIEKNNYQRFYLLKALEHYLGIIRGLIARYDNATDIHNYIDENEKLVQFYSALKAKGYSVRFYTTNYDELIPNILKIGGHELYSGFDVNQRSQLFPNTKKILDDGDVDCYYNLHGSIYWETDTNEKIEPAFLYSPGQPKMNPQAHGEYTNPSERTIIYNVITGFNKLQKVSVEPLRSFFTRLAVDSSKADLILTVGYSFSDSHINRSLNYGIADNNAKFIHITKSANFFGDMDYINMQKHTMNRKSYNDFVRTGAWQTAKDKTAAIYTNGFEDFLKNCEWKAFL